MPNNELTGKIHQVLIDKIQYPEERITSVFDQDLMYEILASIKQDGVKVPIKLLLIEGKLVLIDGLHRILACKQLGIQTIPAIIEEGTWDEVLVQNVLLNRLRGKSDPVQEGLVLKTLMQDHGISLSEAARRCSISPSTASKLVRISSLPEEVQLYIRQGKLGSTVAFELTKLTDIQEQIQTAREAVEFTYNVEQIRARVRQLLTPEAADTAEDYLFSASGQPIKVPTICFICGKEIQATQTYIWLHPACKDDLSLALQSLKPSPTQPPQPPTEEP